MSVIETMKEEDVRRGREYQCTEEDFGGIVKVTEVGSGMVHYTGAADGFAVMSEFVRAYRPYHRSKN
ncbi:MULTISPECIES: hypothetical protein [Burkholderia cepacia complex]|uniref:hypothetical protein n=1 Tax=Burkholderia cepacia complex TaxID=87882 RepID=UPI00061871A7|nr:MULTISPECIES: hypothetical protein [Burkholderia cepacia complex]MBR8093205.1 hypothetical protein [Burkholderia cenocepacia]MBY4714334.1 hypothetical protein [Burkholderia cepacia]MBY4740028.1 hypothetical protein [Burkholderia cepacia]MBY4743461.1 hypothetical protein [Burkholderia cepacia]MBY4757408.1 hypothetical protein [Burkholderia cepacia]